MWALPLNLNWVKWINWWLTINPDVTQGHHVSAYLIDIKGVIYNSMYNILLLIVYVRYIIVCIPKIT